MRSKTSRLSLSIGGVLIAVLTPLAPRADAVQFSDDEQKIVNLLPSGFAPSDCVTASDPPPPLDAAASLQCTSNARGNGPTTGRFTLWRDVETMSGDFQAQTGGSSWFSPSPCPGANSPTVTWSYNTTSDQAAGMVLCGSYQGAPNVEWTRNAQLLTLDVNGGPDIESLFRWWSSSGNPDGGLTPGMALT